MKRFVMVLCVLATCVGTPAAAVVQEHGTLTVTIRGPEVGEYGKVTSSPGGIDCPTDCSEQFPVGETGVPSRTVELTASPYPGAEFVDWELADPQEDADCASSGNTCHVAVGEGRAKSVTAVFTGTPAPTNPLAVSRTAGGTVTSEPAGINCGSACTASFLRNQNVKLIATPDPGGRFSGWAGQWCGGNNPECVVTMDRAKTVAAYFGDAPPPTAMPVIVSKAGNGTITSSPAGIACDPTCSGSFGTGTSVTLAASPAAGWMFVGWGGDCTGTGSCQLTIDGPKALTATFRAQPPVTHALSVVKQGEGTVASDPGGIDCGRTCSRPFAAGSNVTLRAAPAPGWRFVEWRGACSGSAATCSVVMNLPKSATATFARRDVAAPTARALRSSGRRGRVARLRYRAVDDSGTTRVSVTVYRGRRAIARLRRTHVSTGRNVLFYYVSWRVPRKLAKRPLLRFCVAAADPSGNATRRASCAPLRIT